MLLETTKAQTSLHICAVRSAPLKLIRYLNSTVTRSDISKFSIFAGDQHDKASDCAPGPDLGPNCLQRLSATKEFNISKLYICLAVL